jgi:hypothetical protein
LNDITLKAAFMKKYPFRTISFLLLAGALLLSSVAPCDAQRGRSQEGGRLVIWRIPGLGNDLIVDVRIDGKPAGAINYGQHFETILFPGGHVVSVRALPQPYPRPPFAITIDVKPGHLYNFTAKGGTDQLILVRS